MSKGAPTSGFWLITRNNRRIIESSGYAAEGSIHGEVDARACSDERYGAGSAVVITAVDDTGWHDPLGGHGNAALVKRKYGERNYQEARNDWFLQRVATTSC